MAFSWRYHKLTAIFLFVVVGLFGQTTGNGLHGVIASSIQIGGGGSGASGNPGMLDSIVGGNPLPAYSTRYLLSTYTGYCMQIRRESDNAETNIGWVSDTLDTGSINSFCSGTTCYVRIWYDQTGAGFDAYAANEASNNDAMPIIYESGSVTKCNARVAVKFTHPRRFEWSNGSVDLADIVTGGASGSSKKASFSFVGLVGTSATNPWAIYFEDNVDQSEILEYYEDGSTVRIEFIGTAAALTGYTTFTRNTQKMFMGQVDGSDFQGWENTTLKSLVTNGSVQETTNAGLTGKIGGHSFTGRNLEGFMQEVICWDDVVSPFDVFASEDAFYSIP